jgi:hypothetical protein
MIVAVKWPWNSATPPSRAQGDDMGRFQLNGLAPGEYRVIALTSIPQNLMNATKTAFERILEAGKKVELSPGGSRDITLEPSDLTPLRLHR